MVLISGVDRGGSAVLVATKNARHELISFKDRCGDCSYNQPVMVLLKGKTSTKKQQQKKTPRRPRRKPTPAK